jgi:hypothetical protein
MPALTPRDGRKSELIKSNRNMGDPPAGAVHNLRAPVIVRCVALIHWRVRRIAAIMPYGSEIQRVIRALLLRV